MLEDLNIDITEEDISEARREMWGNFPRDIELKCGPRYARSHLVHLQAQQTFLYCLSPDSPHVARCSGVGGRVTAKLWDVSDLVDLCEAEETAERAA